MSEKKIEQKFGKYRNGWICKNCDWKQEPNLDRWCSFDPCPKCGELSLIKVVGRWMYKRTKGFLFWSEWKLSEFIPK